MLVWVQKAIRISQQKKDVGICRFASANLLELLCNHGESSEDCLCGSRDGDDPLWG